MVCVLDKITSAIAEPLLIEGETQTIGASIGVAFFPDDGLSVDSLVHCADRGMYAAKHNREPYRFFGN